MFPVLQSISAGKRPEHMKYYGAVAANKYKENEIKHFCKYHGKSAERKTDSTEEERTEGSVEPRQAQTCCQRPRRPSKDFYIEVSPGVYSVTAISEDMVEQTHVVDVNAGQSIDLTFVL
ncbi:A-kinase-interacting protein 1 isoform X1 [Cyanistes caeruleus]|uniref:A-kinase-interacting protein 1 isoform X1 n=1 Tax=Cyanistes caeruleus TaxID=156563 RepID=UPI000CDA137F|nr:A-kinase-interacting protein 1 isoform X1 [Cyanistes caeruleus]